MIYWGRALKRKGERGARLCSQPETSFGWVPWELWRVNDNIESSRLEVSSRLPSCSLLSASAWQVGVWTPGESGPFGLGPFPTEGGSCPSEELGDRGPSSTRDPGGAPTVNHTGRPWLFHPSYPTSSPSTDMLSSVSPGDPDMTSCPHLPFLRLGHTSTDCAYISPTARFPAGCLLSTLACTTHSASNHQNKLLKTSIP